MDEDSKEQYKRQLDEQSEGEDSAEVADVDEKLQEVGLISDPDGDLRELNAAKHLAENEDQE